MPEKSFLGDKKDKKWWENFWFYYKVHTIVGIISIIILIFSVKECVNKVTPDLSICYMGGKYFSETMVQNMDSTLSQFITDIDGKHGSVAQFIQINLSDNPKSEQDIAMQQRAMLEIAAGESYLYIMDKDIYEKYLEQGLFENLSAELGKSGEVFGIPLKDSKLFSEITDTQDTDFMAAVRVITQGKQDKPKEIARQQNAISVIKEFAKK